MTTTNSRQFRKQSRKERHSKWTLKGHISLRFPAEPHIHVYTMYLRGSIHAVSSFPVLTNGRLTAVCPQNKKIPTETQFQPRALQSRVCCELNSTLADFKRICSRKLSYFASLNSQQIVPHCIAMISNALNINPKYSNINCNSSFRINYPPPSSPTNFICCGQN